MEFLAHGVTTWLMAPPGYASLLATIEFLSGVRLKVIGMMGQYVARIRQDSLTDGQRVPLS
jgi:hypothetical protein